MEITAGEDEIKNLRAAGVGWLGNALQRGGLPSISYENTEREIENE